MAFFDPPVLISLVARMERPSGRKCIAAVHREIRGLRLSTADSRIARSKPVTNRSVVPRHPGYALRFVPLALPSNHLGLAHLLDLGGCAAEPLAVDRFAIGTENR